MTIRKITRYLPDPVLNVVTLLPSIERRKMSITISAFYCFFFSFYPLSLERGTPREGANRMRTNAELHASRTTARERLPVAMTMHRLRLGWAKWMDG